MVGAICAKNADFLFGVPTLLDPPINSEFTVYGCSFSSDGLELYLATGPYAPILLGQALEYSFFHPYT